MTPENKADRGPVSVCVERIRKHISCLQRVRHPKSDPQGLDWAADYIRQQLQELGTEVREHAFLVRGDSGMYRNIEGVINPGSAAPEWVISAHYDTDCHSPGADDNASGVAVMLEAARVLAEHGTGRTVRFVSFSLEEGSPVPCDDSRFLGSHAWLSCALERDAELCGIINLESVGYVGDCQCYPCGLDPACFDSHRFDRTRGDFITILSYGGSMSLGRACFEQCQAPVDMPAILVEIPLKIKKIREQKNLDDILRSDHVPFWEQGLPAITLTDTSNLRSRYYHTEDDTVDKLDMEFAGKVCMATVLTVLRAQLEA